MNSETASSTTSMKAPAKKKVLRNHYHPAQGENWWSAANLIYKHVTFEALTSKVVCHVVLFRQEKEAWIKAKYVEKKFLKKLGSTEILINGERKSERRWSVKKCQRHNSATTVPKTRRRYRQEPGNTSPSTFSSGMSGEMQLSDVVFQCFSYKLDTI